jgi:hypothetical protein
VGQIKMPPDPATQTPGPLQNAEPGPLQLAEITRSCHTTLRGNHGRLRLPPQAARTEGPPKGADAPLPRRGRVPSPPYQRVALACAGQRLRTALLTKALASVIVGRASDCTSRSTTRRKPRPSLARPSHATFPSRNRSLSEAAARSLLPKVIALASATKTTGPVVAVDEEVVASAGLLSLSVLQPAAGAVRRLSRTTPYQPSDDCSHYLAPLLPAQVLTKPYISKLTLR